MDALKSNTATAALVLGYPVLFIIVVILFWFGARVFRDIAKIFDEMRYERWKRKNAERDWGNIEASWALDLDPESQGPMNYHNNDTLELPELSNFKEDRDERP